MNKTSCLWYAYGLVCLGYPLMYFGTIINVGWLVTLGATVVVVGALFGLRAVIQEMKRAKALINEKRTEIRMEGVEQKDGSLLTHISIEGPGDNAAILAGALMRRLGELAGCPVENIVAVCLHATVSEFRRAHDGPPAEKEG